MVHPRCILVGQGSTWSEEQSADQQPLTARSRVCHITSHCNENERRILSPVPTPPGAPRLPGAWASDLCCLLWHQAPDRNPMPIGLHLSRVSSDSPTSSSPPTAGTRRALPAADHRRARPAAVSALLRSPGNDSPTGRSRGDARERRRRSRHGPGARRDL